MWGGSEQGEEHIGSLQFEIRDCKNEVVIHLKKSGIHYSSLGLAVSTLRILRPKSRAMIRGISKEGA